MRRFWAPAAARARRAWRELGAALPLLLAVLAVASCGPVFPQPTNADAARARTRFDDATLPELAQGRERYLARCGNCHALFAANAVSADHWPVEVESMRTKHKVKLSDAEAQAIVRYLVVMGAN